MHADITLYFLCSYEWSGKVTLNWDLSSKQKNCPLFHFIHTDKPKTTQNILTILVLFHMAQSLSYNTKIVVLQAKTDLYYVAQKAPLWIILTTVS